MGFVFVFDMNFVSLQQISPLKYYFGNTETNDAGEPEQIFSTEESIPSRSHRSAHRLRMTDFGDATRPNEELPLDNADNSMDDARTNTTDELNDQMAAVHLTDDSATPIDSLVYDCDSIPTIENKDCEYLKLVLDFKRTLVLPDVFFAYETPICYCALCVSCARSAILKGERPLENLLDELYYMNIYSIWILLIMFAGWVRFKLNQQVLHANKPTELSSISDWTNAFYLSRVDKIRAILDHGQPLPIGKITSRLNLV